MIEYAMVKLLMVPFYASMNSLWMRNMQMHNTVCVTHMLDAIDRQQKWQNWGRICRELCLYVCVAAFNRESNVQQCMHSRQSEIEQFSVGHL